MRGGLSEKDTRPAVPPGGPAGLIVSGAKVVATTSTLTDYNFIANNGALPIKTTPFAFVCIHQKIRQTSPT
jgi:aromatic ring hydroxylase